jgi:hypothetical protein
MTRLDDELEYVCAWGRWRIDQARNEPVVAATPERRSDRPSNRVLFTRLPASTAKPARAVARLRLVADAGAVTTPRRGPLR